MHRRKFTTLSIATLLPQLAAAYEPSSVVDAAPGTLPLLLTVPHDGADFLGLFPHRTKGATVRDAGTRELAERVANLLQQKLGRRPYLVIAKFSRKHPDANRTEADAMESGEMMPAYRAYHDQVAAYVAQIRSKFPSGSLLIDVHGQSDEPNITFRGTRAGLTVKTLLSRFGPSAVQGPDSLIGQLAAKGYGIHPALNADSLREDSRFSGGYTVFTYGSHRPDGIDAIQLEFGKQHRANSRLPEDFAEAIISFMRAFDLAAK
jgi:N-formylglutamate amidohydrolase